MLRDAAGGTAASWPGGVFTPDPIGAYCDDAIDFLRRRVGLAHDR